MNEFLASVPFPIMFAAMLGLIPLAAALGVSLAFALHWVGRKLRIK